MEINPKTSEAYDLLHNGILALAKAERQGFRIDVDYIERKKILLSKKIVRLEQRFENSDFYKSWQRQSTTKINPGSGDQLGKYLYTTLGYKPQKLTKTGKGSTDEEALELLHIPEIDDILTVKKLKKLRDTYLDGFLREQVNGQIHPFYNLNTVVTYRSSSNSPNFQNLPARDEEAMRIVKDAIFPRPGHQLLEVDFKGIEVAVNACINKDPQLIHDILHGDMHGDMAKQIFRVPNFDKSIHDHGTLRSAAKNGFVFPEFYGSYYKQCAEGLASRWGKLPQTVWKPGQGIKFEGAYLSDHLISQGLKSYTVFTKHIERIEDEFWNERFMVYAQWKDTWWAKYQRTGYIDLPTGFRCSGVMNKKQVCNYPGQNGGFICLLWSLIEVTDILEQEQRDTKVVGQIHDSLILDVNPDELPHILEIVKYVTCTALQRNFDWIILPMEVDASLCPVDGSWATKEDCKI